MKSMLFLMISFVGITTLLSGVLMMSIPDGSILGLPLSVLKNTPFEDFKLPGLLLFFFVGSVNMIAVFYNLIKHPKRYNWAIAGGTAIVIWIIIQYLLIQQSMWLDIVYLLCGLIIILTALQLKGKLLI